MVALDHKQVPVADAPERARLFGFDRLIRALPIRWRILSIAALNTAVVVILAALIWDGARALKLSRRSRAECQIRRPQRASSAPPSRSAN